jgi:hypothetical protein
MIRLGFTLDDDHLITHCIHPLQVADNERVMLEVADAN